MIRRLQGWWVRDPDSPLTFWKDGLLRIHLPRTPVNSAASHPRRGNHYHYARHADRRTKHVPTVRPEPVYDYAPPKRQRDEYTAVGCVHPPELGDGLKAATTP